MKSVTIRWRSRDWVVRPASESERHLWTEGKFGQVFDAQGVIVYDDTVSEDMQVMTILHEMAHVMFPEWEAEPSETSRSELGVFERDLKEFLEQMGVDLTAMITEEEPCEGTERS